MDESESFDMMIKVWSVVFVFREALWDRGSYGVFHLFYGVCLILDRLGTVRT